MRAHKTLHGELIRCSIFEFQRDPSLLLPPLIISSPLSLSAALSDSSSSMCKGGGTIESCGLVWFGLVYDFLVRSHHMGFDSNYWGGNRVDCRGNGVWLHSLLSLLLLLLLLEFLPFRFEYRAVITCVSHEMIDLLVVLFLLWLNERNRTISSNRLVFLLLLSKRRDRYRSHNVCSFYKNSNKII